MKKVVVVGSNGLLGQSLINRFATHFDTIALSHSNVTVNDENIPYYQIDMVNRTEVSDLLSKIKPDIIINSAAYTNVDGSEEEKELCWSINVRSVENIIDAVESYQPILIQVSTDYVFDGQKGWYTEIDTANPRGNYARSKYAAENIVATSSLEYIIARTQILYGFCNKLSENFVTWVVNKLRNNEKIKVVFDQIGNPTFTDDFSESLYRLLEREEYGLFHISGKEGINRYEFAL